jgi:hypothetical protein
VGLPPRITGVVRGTDDRAGARREVVIENDIGWRVHAMVDFLLGKPVRITSTARDESRRAVIERVLDRVFEHSGGIALLQEMALLGHVYGHVDLVVRVDDDLLTPRAVGDIDDLLGAAGGVRIEVVEPRRGIPILNPDDYRDLRAYVVRCETPRPRGERPGLLSRVLGEGATTETVEVLSADARQVYRDGRLIYEQDGPRFGGALPVVHIQNMSQPFRYEGLSEVEPLIPLQDELNTRLSDRACRVTLQSFKMYLARGIEGFDKGPVGPGVVWATDNPDAAIEAFGGDAASPSEESHIREVRDALDKASGVPPMASGVVQGKVGNLSSANALRITLMGVLAKTARKQVTYGGGIARACGLVLAALDQAGVLRTAPGERGVRLEWPDPLPVDEQERTRAAEAKARLGVPRARVLEELGYAATDPGVA